MSDDQTTRRDFIKTTGAAAAAGAVAGQVAGDLNPAQAAEEGKASGGEPDMDVGKHIYKTLKWGMIKEKLSVMDKFKLLQDLGYDGVELNSPGGVNKKEARKAVEATGFPVDGLVNSIHWKVRLTDPDAATRARSVEGLKTALRDAHYVGAHSVLLVAGHGKDGPPDVIWDRAVEGVKRALPLAAKLGVFILIENVWNSFMYEHNGPDNQTADQFAKFCDEFNSPWVGMQYDIGNHVKYGPPEEWIRTLGKRIVKLDTKGYKIGKGFCKIGEGSVDYAKVRAAFKEIGFKGWCAAEVGGGDRNRLKEVLDNMNRCLGPSEKVT